MSDVPTEVHLHTKSKKLSLHFADEILEITFEMLRVYSPSAEVRGHSEGERKLQHGKKHVAIVSAEPVGNYALRFTFDDGHDSGIYSWEFLRDLAENRDRYWGEYVRELEQANASRLPPIAVGQWRPE